ncbi:hypothetical protein [Tenacibaculum aestuarii]|uniref:hypothetical protein n=1 Tax=Tenacibaculum aestuarii TaxID=362781 RepID=UPI0038947F09
MKKLLSAKRITFFLILSFILIAFVPFIHFVDYDTKDDRFGLWPLIAIAIILIGLFILLIDYILFKIVKDKILLNLIEVVLFFIIAYFLWPN